MEEKKLDKDINVRSKTELSDEEIVKALAHCSNNRSCVYCYHNDEVGSGEIVCRSRLMGKTLDLIHRLQVQIEVLTDSKNALETDKCNNEMNLEAQGKLIAEQKAEIERLTKKAERAKIDLENEKNWGKIQTKQAVKDTAKEIFDDLYLTSYEIDVQVKDYEMHKEAINIVGKAILKVINMRMRAVAKRYGVEVE